MSTVSNVLNNPRVVSADTRRRVEDAMAAVGYVRNGAARQLRGAPSVTVGRSTDVRTDRESRYLRMLEELGVRGVLLSPVSARLDSAVALAHRETPVVAAPPAGVAEAEAAVAQVLAVTGEDFVRRYTAMRDALRAE